MALARIDGPAKAAAAARSGEAGAGEATLVGTAAAGRAVAARLLGEADDAAASAAVELRGGGLLTCEAFAFRIP